MGNYDIIAQQEQQLWFDEFTNDIAIEIGNRIIALARSEGKSIACDISKAGQQLFHAALAGTSTDNDFWAMRKRNTINRFFESTLGLQLRCKENGEDVIPRFGLEPLTYTESGGAFPINVKGAGFVGAIIVTGSWEEDDHDLIVRVLKEYLGAEDCPRYIVDAH